MINILIVGSGGRESALAYRLKASPSLGNLYVLPGSDGLEEVAIRLKDKSEVRAELVDLVIFGGESELVAGWSDEFREMGIAVLGCSQAASALEGSKDFLKSVLFEAGVPCASSCSFTDLDQALDYLKTRDLPIVLKTDGLAGGKGVVICETQNEAKDWLCKYLSGEAFGEAGKCVIIEDYLQGSEVSFFVLVDSASNAHPLAASRDHKRIFDGDKGANTGGMGAFTPVPEFTPKLCDEVMKSIILPSLTTLQKRGTAFQGFLFAGLMLTTDGPKLLEYNIRLGDPEAQVILPAIKGDFAKLCHEAALGAVMTPIEVDIMTTRINVVLAAKGYPLAPEKGAMVLGLDELQAGVDYYHAGTAWDEGWRVSGGRVLNVFGEGKNIDAAREEAYAKIGKIRFDGMQFRKDIGKTEA